MLVGFAGNCGTGKSTISREVAKRYEGVLVLEDEKANPYFSDFIHGRKETAFHAELAFLSNKLLDIENANPKRMVVVDRIPEEDVEIFARYWADQGLLNATDFGLYQQVAGQLLRAARSFDVIVYLHGPVDLLVERLRNRRDSAFNERVEKMVRCLQPLYDEWIENLDSPLIRFPIDENDVKGEDGERVLAGLIDAIERFRFPLFGEQSG